MAASLLLILWFYGWTVSPQGLHTFIGDDDQSYYNLLARGLLKGQLALDLPADPALATMADPYDPAERGGRGLHDASYYRGKYYIYFGITPVLLIFLPFHALTGTYLAEHGAIGLFAFGGLLLAWAIVGAVIRTHFPRTSLPVKLACLWALGLATMVPPLLRRPHMWEVPIACGYALFMLTLYCVWRALTGPARVRWMAGASLAMGLCIGARPTYLAAAVVLLAPLVQDLVRTGWTGWRKREFWRLAIFIVLPIATVGAGLALYNFLRFDHPLEFGQTYQLAGENVTKLQVFSPRYFLYNLRIYLFAPPGFTPYFPFLTVIDQPAALAGHLGIENPYGIIPGMPWVLFALAAGWRAVRRGGNLGWWCGAALTGIGLVLATVCCFAGNTGRYEVDFTPGLALLGAIGAVSLAASGNRRLRRAVTALAVGLACWSAGFNLLISLQHNRLLEMNHPALHAKIARACNHLPYWLAKLTGHRDGPVEIRLVFPVDKTGTVEPLVVTGHQFLADYLFVHYLGSGRIRFGLEHTSRGAWTGPETRIDPAAEHTLFVQMGSLHPPAAHPIYDGMSATDKDLRTRSVTVKLDGRTVLQLTLDCYDASDWAPTIGTSGPNRPAFKQDFSGRILSWRRLPPLSADASGPMFGRLRLVLRLPAYTRPRSEPLLSTGEAGKGDLIYIRYLEGNRFQIGHDRWGYGGTEGPVTGYDPEVPIDLEVSCPPLLGADAPPRLIVTLNGSTLIDVEEPFHPSRPTQIGVGLNLIGASTAEEGFSGAIVIQERVVE